MSRAREREMDRVVAIIAEALESVSYSADNVVACTAEGSMFSAPTIAVEISGAAFRATREGWALLIDGLELCRFTTSWRWEPFTDWALTVHDRELVR